MVTDGKEHSAKTPVKQGPVNLIYTAPGRRYLLLRRYTRAAGSECEQHACPDLLRWW
jgi:hypothetical protein